MKKFTFIYIAALVLISSCKKGKPIIAEPDEMSVATISHNFICQPVAYENNIVGVVNKNNSTYLCSYGTDAVSEWQVNIDAYAMAPNTFINIPSINLSKDNQDNLIMNMYHIALNNDQTIKNQLFKGVKFDQSGQYLWQIADSIHQPDTIIIALDTIDMIVKDPFMAKGFVCLSGGNYAVISSLPDTTIDSTYIQISIYNVNVGFVSDNYFKMTRPRNIIDIYATSNNHLFMANTDIETNISSYMIIDLNGNILSEIPAGGILNDTYFFKETSNGKTIFSASYFDGPIRIMGTIICFDNLGLIEWENTYDFDPTLVMLSVQELSDGFLFSGFSSTDLLLTGIDWRTTFTENEHHSVVQKTDLNGREIWRNSLKGNLYSAAAISIGSNPYSIFGGRYEPAGQSIYLLKLNTQGEIFN